MRPGVIGCAAIGLLAVACSNWHTTPGGGDAGRGGAAAGRGGADSGGSGGGGDMGGRGGLGGTGGGVAGSGIGGGAGGISGVSGVGGSGGVGGVGGGGVGGIGGIAGVGGVAGVAGQGGIGGAISCGGQGGFANNSCPLCPTTQPLNLIEACVLAEDGAPLKMSVSASVTVVSVDDVAGGNCRRVDYATSGGSTRHLVLQAATGGQRWTVYMRVPNLPASIISANDALDLVVTASTGGFLSPGEAQQTIALVRSGQLLAFGVADGSALPQLGSFGIQVSDGGEVCKVERCANVPRRTQVTVGNMAATLDQGETRQVGDVSFTVEEHSRWFSNGGCDGNNRIQMGGYVVR